MSTISSRAIIALSRRTAQQANLGPCLSARGQATTTSSIPVPLPDAASTSTPWNSHARGESSSLVQNIRDERDLQNLLTSAKPDGLVVVKFHATLCSSSKKIESKYEETASEFSDMAGPGTVHFAQINYDQNQELCQQMGIESLPHVHIFSGKKGKIADFSIAPSKFDTLPSLLTERRQAAAAIGGSI